MYTVCVRDHIMIAHSLRGDVFGPAQKLHGATYIVDLEMRAPSLDSDGIVVDMGRATEVLRTSIADLNYRNLDEAEAAQGQNTTTEFLARLIFDRVVGAIRRGDLGPGGSRVASLAVRLHESHVAWAAFEGPVNDGAS